jgi:hypothetical protein
VYWHRLVRSWRWVPGRDGPDILASGSLVASELVNLSGGLLDRFGSSSDSPLGRLSVRRLFSPFGLGLFAGEE